jgi:hypothetical protein
MTQHTSGPWTIANYPHAVVVKMESHKKTAYGASRYAAIGGFDRSDPEQMAEALADACLIAAAPELLAALEGMEKWASSIHDGYPPSTASIAAAPYREAARAAIAKATGEVK